MIVLFLLQAATAVAAFIIIGRIYDKHYSESNYTEGYFNKSLLHTHNILAGGIWPEDPGFWSLRFSVIRHFAVNFIFALISYFADNAILGAVLIFLSLTYTSISVLSFVPRQRDCSTSSAQAALIPVRNACATVLIHNIIVLVLFVVSYIVAGQ